MDDPREAAATRFEAIAEEFGLAAKHCRATAARVRAKEVPRAGAHAFATYGHLHRPAAGLEHETDVLASSARPTTE